MVIGNGLFANTFQSFKNNNDVVIFASGVSNSKEKMNSEFQREKILLIDTISKLYSNQILIYFSTCSVYDKSLLNSKYIQHKLKIEKIIQNNVLNYLIFRMPIVISKTHNPNTLINYLIEHIKSGKKFSLYNNACRYLIAIDDIYNICNFHIKYFKKNKIENIVSDNRIKVVDLVKMIEKVYNKKAIYEIVNVGECYEVPNTIKNHLLNSLNLNVENYIFTKLCKYKLID